MGEGFVRLFFQKKNLCYQFLITLFYKKEVSLFSLSFHYARRGSGPSQRKGPTSGGGPQCRGCCFVVDAAALLPSSSFSLLSFLASAATTALSASAPFTPPLTSQQQPLSISSRVPFPSVSTAKVSSQEIRVPAPQTLARAPCQSQSPPPEQPKILFPFFPFPPPPRSNTEQPLPLASTAGPRQESISTPSRTREEPAPEHRAPSSRQELIFVSRAEIFPPRCDDKGEEFEEELRKGDEGDRACAASPWVPHPFTEHLFKKISPPAKVRTPAFPARISQSTKVKRESFPATTTPSSPELETEQPARRAPPKALVPEEGDKESTLTASRNPVASMLSPTTAAALRKRRAGVLPRASRVVVVERARGETPFWFPFPFPLPPFPLLPSINTLLSITALLPRPLCVPGSIRITSPSCAAARAS